jgi:hypothetical protein
MKPSQVSQKLLLIASKIQASSNPNRELVIRDLHQILSFLKQGHAEIGLQDVVSDDLSGLSNDEKIVKIQSPEFQTFIRKDMGLGPTAVVKYDKAADYFRGKGFDDETADFYAYWSADDFT